jgi:hypothetical protein
MSEFGFRIRQPCLWRQNLNSPWLSLGAPNIVKIVRSYSLADVKSRFGLTEITKFPAAHATLIKTNIMKSERMFLLVILVTFDCLVGFLL